MTKGIKRYIIYARFSTDKQNKKSAADQIKECEEYIDKKNGRVVEIFNDDAKSGGSTFGRKNYQRMLKYLPTGKCDVLIAESIDRIARNLADMASLYELLQFHEIELVTLSEGADVGEVEVALKGLMASLYIKDVSRKTKRGLRAKAEAGKNPGSCPYGFRPSDKRDPVTDKKITGELIRVEEEIKVIKRLFYDFIEGRPIAKTQRELNAEGIPGPGSKDGEVKPWTYSAIRYILKNQKYNGTCIYNRKGKKKDPRTGETRTFIKPKEEWIVWEDKSLKIINDNIWKAAQARFEKTRRNASRKCAHNKLTGMRRTKYLLSGLLVCSECEGSYVLGGGKGRYICTNYKRHLGCNNGTTILQNYVENQVLNTLREKFLVPERMEKTVKACHQYIEKIVEEQSENNRILRKEIKELEKKAAAISKAFEDGLGSKTLQKRLKSIEAKIEEKEGQLVETPEIKVPDDTVLKDCRAMIDDLSGNLNDVSVRYKLMNIIRPLIQKIILHPTDDGLRAELHGSLAKLVNLRGDDEGNFFYTAELDIEQLRYLNPAISDSIVIFISLPLPSKSK